MVIGRHVAVRVLDLGAPAVAAVPLRLDDRAIAGRDDRRADAVGPIDAGVHLGVAENRVAPVAEPGPEDAVGDRLADKELLERASGLVEIIDRAVVRRLEAVYAAGLASHRQGRIKEFGALRAALLVHGEEDLEGVADADASLEIHVVSEDADEVLDRLAGQIVLQPGFVEALIEFDAAALLVIVFLVLLGFFRSRALLNRLDGRCDRDECAAVIDRRDRFDPALAEQDHAHDLPPVAGPWTGADEDAHVLALGGVAADPRPESREDGSDLVACRAIRLQHAFEALAALEGDIALINQRFRRAGLQLG